MEIIGPHDVTGFVSVIKTLENDANEQVQKHECYDDVE